jgi:phosphatidylinositol alpha-1,6-mannosyltransferase
LGTHAFELARQLTRLGWTISVLSNQDHRPDEEIVRFNAAQSIKIRRVPRRAIPLASIVERWKEANAEIAGFQPDLLMATGDRAVYVAADLAAKYRVPWVAIEHGTIPRGIEWRLKRWAYGRADLLVCVSNYTWRQAEQNGISPKRLVIIPNGADSARFRPLDAATVQRIKSRLQLEGKRILLTVGSVSHRKGQDNVIRALPRILERFSNTVYVCAGVDLAGDEFADLARLHSVRDSVRFLGPIGNDEIVDLMNAADIFLMTSRHTGDEFEGYGIAAVEAALCGTPSIVTGDSGLREAIVEDVTGLTVPQNDPGSIANCVIRLLDDETLRLTMGEAAHEHASREQTWEHRARNYDEIYRSVLTQTLA